MDKYFICLANSYKHGGRCLAGIEVTFVAEDRPVIVRHSDGRPRWIRPVSNEPDGSIPNEIAKDIKLFSVVRLVDAVPCPDKAHVEDTKYSKVECGNGHFTPNEELLKLCLDKKHQNIFYFQGKAVPAQMVERLDYSLMLIKPDDVQAYIDEEREKSKYRMKFSYFGLHYDFPITDPVFLEAFKMDPEHYSDLKDIYLALSLGLEFEGFHYKLVAAVIQIEDSSKQEKTDDWFEEYDKLLSQLINQKKALEEQMASLRASLIEQMELRGLEKVDSKQFSVVYSPSKTIMKFDGKTFRKENEDLYAHYCKAYEKGASIVVRSKPQNNDDCNE